MRACFSNQVFFLKKDYLDLFSNQMDEEHTKGKNMVKEEKDKIPAAASQGDLLSRKVMEEVSGEAAAHSDVLKPTAKTSDITDTLLDDSSQNKSRECRFSPATGKEDSQQAEPERVLQELEKEKEDLSQRSRQLQRKLTGYICKAAQANIKLRRTRDQPTDRYEYEVCIQTLTDLKQQIRAYKESAQAQAEELRSQLQEKLEKVETEQQELDALRRSAVPLLSPHLGEEAAQARVEASLRAEKLAQDSLTKVRLKHFKLMLKVCRLEAELSEEGEFNKEVLKVKKQELEAEQRRRQKKQSERNVQDLLNLMNQHDRVSKVLPKVKKKLCQIQVEVQNKRQQQAEVEAAVAKKKDLLTRTKQARDNLQRDNLKLEESRGLLGNRILLQDFEDTVDAADQLEKQLETLKLQRDEMISCCDKIRNLIE